MKVYYIDDSFFQTTDFAREILHRFENYKLLHGNGPILISAAKQENAVMQEYIRQYDEGIILTSPALFDMEGVRGNLHSTLLSLEGFAPMQTYSGSFVEYDTETMCCKRIYLEMFIHHTQSDIDVMKQMLEMLDEQLAIGKHKQWLH